MADIDVEELLPYVDAKYTLVTLAAKRARELVEGQPVLIHPRHFKPVTIALEEIGSGVITYRRAVDRVR
ncbi:MAG TPA: DNA-directed RNA polymerase subunit omega [Firmicutes bacterium]|nr:DNA-directed RNA polymerase subunit omega [Bacillota bacterium]